ncbi:hypothetical protein LIER_37012 [Lithospermum erythrorhizon]|uniref:non-specific serine/threonine protein kinase n=1 Tax=Lithospermum erythrorhizon TaxID=34254 RepID=A0AAV3PI63_LITER
MEIKENILMQKYKVGKLLGRGTFAKVYHARSLKTGQNVAIKVINKSKVQKVGLIDQTKREISAMGLVKHQNVVQLYEVMATKTKIYCVMEYAKGGELFYKVAKGRLEEDVARRYFQQLIKAIDFCHSRGIYHRDLKPENLLLDESGILKVSDFGLSALTESVGEDGLLHTTCGTPSYVAPEVVSRKGYDGVKSDIWSCGVILFVMLSGQLPFHDSNLMEMYRKISRADYKCPSWFSAEVRMLLCRMLDPNPYTRISTAKIMENPWFKKGFDFMPAPLEVEGRPSISLNKESTVFTADEKLGQRKPVNLNAFDIISLSSGIDLSGLFVSKDQKDEAKFTAARSSKAIISKLEDIARKLKLKVRKKDDALLKLEEVTPGKVGTVSMEAELFEITSSFYLVELRKSGGETLEYQKMLREDIRPALKEIVWAWQGE